MINGDILQAMLGDNIITSKFYKWLMDSGFKTAPASTIYHGNHEGGLYEHSCEVTRHLVKLTDALNLQWKRKESPWIVGMFHDLCKIDAYKQEMDGYSHNDNTLLKGHGDKSVMLLSQFMTLTEEEIMCIRYHMGAYETDNWKQFDLAIKEYPNVLFTHTADMLASKLSV